ncbi:c-type cytochrome [Luteolibacter luteus]|uniref:Cytochrome c n=1 Tax=Luteolibacter luteus TaxID=2728835 RepID=A0A858RJ82_9BACT|nr:cytochrome c [Luteolibacter luteus]QJE96902.1 cytochrome c [Luteolibacter luteus]
MKHPIVFAALFSGSAALAANTPAELFQMNCSACHAVDHMLVGPSLVEISGLYRDNPDDFVKWCIQPQHKREGVVEMPSMTHLGEPALRELHQYVIAAAAGKTELKKGDGDPFTPPREMVRRPQVQRIFLPDASPAAIAVALPGDLSYCFDAGECRLRYVWKGGFIVGTPYWKANGSSLAKLDGDVVYRETEFPVAFEGESKHPELKFHGYRVSKEGIPTFSYSRDGVAWQETILPLPDGSGIERRFESTGGRPLAVRTVSGISVSSSTGTGSIGAPEAKSFTLTYRWK